MGVLGYFGTRRLDIVQKSLGIFLSVSFVVFGLKFGDTPN